MVYTWELGKFNVSTVSIMNKYSETFLMFYIVHVKMRFFIQNMF